MSWFNFQNFYSFIAQKDFQVFVEVGVWKGESITYLTKKILEHKNDFSVYAVDLFDKTYKWTQNQPDWSPECTTIRQKVCTIKQEYYI